MRDRTIKYFCLVLVVFIVACSSKRSVVVNSETEKPSKIIFLNYSIKRHPKGGLSLQLINTTISEGQLKSNKRSFRHQQGGLKCIQKGKDKEVLDYIYVEDPLNKHVEYVDEKGSFSKRQIQLDSSTFFVRMMLYPKTKFITIESVDQPTKDLLTNELFQ